MATDIPPIISNFVIFLDDASSLNPTNSEFNSASPIGEPSSIIK